MQTFVTGSEPSSDWADSDDSSASAQSTNLMYEEGAVLALRAHELGNRMLTVQVLKLYHPFSFSCVMKVEILDTPANCPQRAILKLHDRRFARKLRLEHKVDAWTPRLEDHFVNFVNSGAAAKFVKTLQQCDSEQLEEPEAGWSSLESEAYLQAWCTDTCATEVDTYRHLRSLQGNEIPKLWSSVALVRPSRASGAVSGASASSPLLQVRGLLLEYIAGPTLAQLPDFVQPQYWQVVVEDALMIVHKLSDRNVINEGIRAANMIAGPSDTIHGSPRVVMIDLARCCIRQNDQTDPEWGAAKAEQDEEGTIARSMSSLLKKVAFELRYTPSGRFEAFATTTS